MSNKDSERSEKIERLIHWRDKSIEDSDYHYILSVDFANLSLHYADLLAKEKETLREQD